MELNKFQELVARRLGLRFSDKDERKLRRVVEDRLRQHRLAGWTQYERLLRSGPPAEREWEELASLLTTGETFFFRDRGQMQLLQQFILPELIAAKRCERSLRIWSAGCSSGEEAYSLAMLLDRILPRSERWRVLLLGTDIDTAALERARRGVYRDWSFRGVDEDWRREYFVRCRDGWQIDQRIRRMVEFSPHNLLHESLPKDRLHDLDLIVCRNVFLYFAPESIAVVLAELASALRPGGVLVTGRGELSGVEPGPLEPQVYPTAVIYRKTADSGTTPASETARSTADPPSRQRPGGSLNSPPGRPREGKTPIAAAQAERRAREADFAEIERMLEAGDHAAAVQHARVLLRQIPKDWKLRLLLARGLANIGRHREATGECRQAAGLVPLDPAPWYLQAQIAEDQGDCAEAVSLLRKVLYLAPQHIAAHLDLASLHDREGRSSRARQLREAARELLSAMPPETEVRFQGRQTVAELSRKLEAMVKHE